jgi:hypothetical protein
VEPFHAGVLQFSFDDRTGLISVPEIVDVKIEDRPSRTAAKTSWLPSGDIPGDVALYEGGINVVKDLVATFIATMDEPSRPSTTKITDCLSGVITGPSFTVESCVRRSTLEPSAFIKYRSPFTASLVDTKRILDPSFVHEGEEFDPGGAVRRFTSPPSAFII